MTPHDEIAGRFLPRLGGGLSGLTEAALRAAWLDGLRTGLLAGALAMLVVYLVFHPGGSRGSKP